MNILFGNDDIIVVECLGELRRRSVEDEHMMRKYLQEGDLISAEVQSTYDDGSVSLHTRSLKYGKVSSKIILKF